MMMQSRLIDLVGNPVEVESGASGDEDRIDMRQ